jgi:hypothetical protein
MSYRIALAALAALALHGCAPIAAGQANTDVEACLTTANASPEAQIIFVRLWANDPSKDNADKLSDPRPLTKEERNALVAYHNRTLHCREIIVAHDTRWAPAELPIWEQYFQRSDAIYLKLASGEIAVGTANRLAIESNGKFQVDHAQGRAEAVRAEDAQRQAAAEAMMRAGATLSKQPTMTTTDCNWMGSTLSCSSMRQ